MKTILKYVGISILVALGGILFMECFSLLMNGLDRDVARGVGIGIYSCMTTVVCTGVIVSHIQKNEEKGNE